MRKKNNLNPTSRIEGKSLYINLALVILNLVGVTFTVMGFHSNFAEASWVLLSIGLTALVLSTIGLYVLQGSLLMSSILRILVGGLLMVSGLVKANDPIGFSYKLEEYFEDGALAYRIKEWFGMPEFSLEYFIQYALSLSILICALEIALGVFVILGKRLKITSLLLIAMMAFFTFLTWHTATCDGSVKFTDRNRYALNDPIGKEKLQLAKTNKDLKVISTKQQLIIDELKQPQCVDDCGCFGDAMKGSVGRSLTPMESLWKDIVLLYFSIWIAMAAFKRGDKQELNFLFYIVGSLIVVAFLCWVFSWYFMLLFSAMALLGGRWCISYFSRPLTQDVGVKIWTLSLVALMVWYVLAFDTIKDYRPYAVGSDLAKKMKDGDPGKYQNLVRYKHIKTGEIVAYDGSSKAYADSKIWENKNYKYLDIEQKEIVPMRIPSITDQFNPYIPTSALNKEDREMPMIQNLLKTEAVQGLRILDKNYNSTMEIPMEEYDPAGFPESEYQILDTLMIAGEEPSEINIRSAILDQQKIGMLVAKSLRTANWNEIEQIKAVAKAFKKRSIPFILLVSASGEEIERFRKKYNIDFPVFINDETELKAIARSNPSLLIIEKGVVTNKFPHRSIPTSEWFELNILDKK